MVWYGMVWYGKVWYVRVLYPNMPYRMVWWPVYYAGAAV